MTPELWARLKPLYDAALDTPPEGRNQFVAEACGDDAELRRECEALLAANDDGSFDRPLVDLRGLVPAARAFSEGQMLLGRFRIVRILGHGGMGEVYEVEDRFLQGVHVALKTILPHIAGDRDLRQRFEREVLLAREVVHPNLCSIYDIFHSDEPPPGIVFLTMKLLPGCTLGERLRQGVPITPQHKVAVFRQTLLGLAAIHEAGIIHRDIKSNNVMLDGSGTDLRLWITDFGLARGYENATTLSAQSVAGTPGYLAPELFLGHPPSKSSDLFALGVMLHEVFTGEKPLPGANGTSHIVSSRLNTPAVPAYCIALITGCLSHDPARRSTAFAQALENIHPKSERRNSWPTRQRAWVWPLAVTVVLLLAYLFRPALPAPSVSATKQLTHDGGPKLFPVATVQRLVTDGSRIYFNELANTDFKLMQVSTDGGETVPIEVPFESGGVLDISPVRSELLVAGGGTCSDSDSGCPSWQLPVPGGQPRRIGNLLATDSSWSRDGKIIYSSKGHDLYASQNDGTGPQKLLTTNGSAAWIRPSPDGRLLRFTVLDDKLGTSSLWESKVDGSQLNQLFPGLSNPANECCGEWTPDGKYFVFESTQDGVSNLWARREVGASWKLVNRKPVQLTVGGMNAQSPLPGRDGKKLYFIGSTPRAEMMRFDQKKQRFVAYLPGLSAEGLAFTTDGERMAYISFPEGILWQSKADGTDRHQLTFPPMLAGLPRWSPDAKQIAFAGRLPGKTEKTYLVSAEGGNPEQITAGNGRELDPSWSPDGTSLAFTTETGSTGGPLIQAINLKTREIVTVPESNGLSSPRWSPDGRFLFAEHLRELRLFDFSTHTWQKLAEFPLSYPDWSKDGKCIYGVGEGKDLPAYRICLKDRKPVLVAHLGDAGELAGGRFGGWTGLGPDESILGTRDISVQEIYALDVRLP